MLDGKRYYAAFPDEDPECDRGSWLFSKRWEKVEKAFRKHAEAFQADEVKSATTSAPPLAPQ